MNNEHRVPDFAAFVAGHRHGELALELEQALAAVVAASLAHDKGGSLTLTIKVEPANASDTLILTGAVKASPAKAPVAGAVYYATTDGGLHTGDPYRQPLPFAAHDLTGDAPLATVHDLTTDQEAPE